MIVVSDKIKESYNKFTTQRKSYIQIGDNSFFIQNLDVQADAYNDGNVIGNAIAKIAKFDIETENVKGIEEFELFDGIWTGNQYEYISLGKFKLFDEEGTDDFFSSITAYDKLIDFNKQYIPDLISFPISLYDFLKAICQQAGIELENASIPNGDKVLKENLFVENETLKLILNSICQISGNYAIISNNKLKLLLKGEEKIILSKSQISSPEFKRTTWKINQVILGMSDIEGEYSIRQDAEDIEINGIHKLVINDNPFVYSQDLREEYIDALFEQVRGFGYEAFNTNWEGLPYVELGDLLEIDGHESIVLRYNIKSPKGLESTIEAPSIIDSVITYVDNSNSIRNQQKRTEYKVNKHEQYIEQLVSDMYEEDGVINENFTKILQDIENIINNVQNSGGSNLIKNSVMFAYDNDNIPSNWDIEGAGKNLFDKDNVNILNAYLSSDKIVSSSSARVIYIPCSPNTTYIIQKVKGNAFSIAYTETTPIIGATIIDRRNTASSPTLTITTGENAKYLVSQIMDGGDVLTEEEILNSIQIEKGLSASPYESYTDGELIIESNTESFNAGCLSGHIFTLNNKIARQKIEVKIDNDDTIEKVYYTFSTKIKKGLDGNCYVKIYNSIEEYIIELKEGQESFYGDYEIKGLLPKDSYYIIEFYGSADSNATFTDNMFAIGEYKSKWQQANGEIMNTQVNINVNGVLVKSSIYQGDYTIMSPLEFAGYSKINGTITKVFSLNKDVTLVKKLEAEDEIKMVPIKVVPITSGDLQGWAFVPSTGGGN